MARRASTKPAPEVTETEAPVESTESTETVETPAAEASTESTPTEAPAEDVIDISKLEEALAAALDASDESTGTVPDKNLSDVVAAYRELEGAKAKGAARKLLTAKMKDAVNVGEIGAARSIVILQEAIANAPSSGGSTTRERTPVDPTEAYVATAVRLRLAMQLHVEAITPEVSSDWKDKVNARLEELTPQLATWKSHLEVVAKATDEAPAPEAPEVDVDVKSAFRLATGRAAGPAGRKTSRAAGDGVRRDIAKHITEAFSGKEVGAFMSIAELKAFKSAEYGDVQPSAGALNARLFPTDKDGASRPTTVAGVEGLTLEGTKGARKTA